MRLSDVYYTTNNLDGWPEPTGGKSEALNCYQGESIELDVYLNKDAVPIDSDKWEVRGVVKSNVYATCKDFELELNNGIYKNDKIGYYKLFIPPSVTSEMHPGTYWLSVKIKEKSGNSIHDRELVVMKQPFSISLSTTSPNPKLDRVELERTVPPPFDASKM